MITVLLLSPALDVTYLVESVEAGAIHRPREVLRLPGGKGLNLARAATALGATVRVIVPLGGHIGALIAALAHAEGVETLAIDVDVETRSCVTVIADDTGSLTEFYERASALSTDEVRAVSMAVATLPEAEAGWTALSGSIPPDLDADELVAMLRLRSARGDRLAIDTHGPALATLVRELHPELVKINRLEASQLLGLDGDALVLARAVAAVTGGTVVITDGTQGSAAVDGRGGEWRVRPAAAPGRYSVGSGDTFFAGLLWSLGAGESLPEALAVASAAAAANAEMVGAARFDAQTMAERRETTIIDAQHFSNEH